MRIFNFLDYKKYLKEVIRENRGTHGYKTRLAKAAGCRSSYLSQVLHGNFDLSPEHALGLANFWGLSTTEKDFFIQLVHLARAGTKELKKYYESICRDAAAELERVAYRGHAEEVT